MPACTDPDWPDALQGLRQGDFSRLEPLFGSGVGHACRIVQWHEQGCFASEPQALAEALTCACFLGRAGVAAWLLDKGVDPAAGIGTGLAALHWAANRGQLEAVRLLLDRKAPLEQLNMYGGTVLGCAVWSAVHEPRADHLRIIEALLAAGAKPEAAATATGHAELDALLQRYRARS